MSDCEFTRTVTVHSVIFKQDCFNQLTQMVPMVVDNDTKTAGGLSRKTKAVVLNQSEYQLTGGGVWAMHCTFYLAVFICACL